MFVVHKKGMVKNGKNPTLLTGYGGFNISMTPTFSRSPFIWLEHGGIYAVANLRGGSEFGEDWHRAGMLDKKQNVFDDFVAAAEAAADTARSVFEAGGAGGELPQIMVPRDTLGHGMPAFELFVRAGLAASNGEARRLIKGRGARLNDAVVESEAQTVSLGDLDAQGQIKLSAGRKRHALVRPE